MYSRDCKSGNFPVGKLQFLEIYRKKIVKRVTVCFLEVCQLPHNF